MTFELQENPPHVRNQKTTNLPSRTRQAFKDETDINRILGKWRTTGVVLHANVGTPVYGDFTKASDYMTSLNSLMEAQALFASMPARVRKECENNPAKLIALIENPENADLLQELGLKNPVSPEPVPVPVIITNGGNPPDGEEIGSDPS